MNITEALGEESTGHGRLEPGQDGQTHARLIAIFQLLPSSRTTGSILCLNLLLLLLACLQRDHYQASCTV